MEYALLNPAMAPALGDARRQLHHAAQFATAAGISYLIARADDSHTNLEWLSESGMLASNIVRSGTPFRVAVRASDLTLVLLGGDNKPRAELSLHGRTIDNATTWLRARLAQIGVDPGRFTLKRHYQIPGHPVASGAKFDTTDLAALAQLAAWFDTAAHTLEAVRGSTQDVSEVRCWPHHFDIAVLIDVGPGKTVGVGLDPGDVYYDEPYFYVNAHPQPVGVPAATLAGCGTWHSHEWIGGVLPVSRLEPPTARDDIRTFIDSAVVACRAAIASA